MPGIEPASTSNFVLVEMPPFRKWKWYPPKSRTRGSITFDGELMVSCTLDMFDL